MNIKRFTYRAIIIVAAYFMVTIELRQQRFNLQLPEMGPGFTSIHAAEDKWFFVRQSATWARGNSGLADAIISALVNAGLFKWPAGDYTHKGLVSNSETFNIRLGVQGSYTAISSAYSGIKSFSYKFIMFRASDNARALELFFDTTSGSSGDGNLLVYNLNVLNPSVFTGTTALVESYGHGEVGARHQTYSWNDPLVSGGSSDTGRVVLQEMSGVLCFKSVVKTTLTSTLCTGTLYYSLAYGVKIASPNQSTAKYGIAADSIDANGQLCGFANADNFGLFNDQGFISDGQSTIPDGFPTASAVTSLYSQIAQDPAANSLPEGHDLRKSKLDSLNNSIAWRDTSAAP